MVCLFCRNAGHNKSNCTNEYVLEVQAALIHAINTVVNEACRRHINHVQFEITLKRWLRDHNVLELKMVIEYYKRIIHTNYGNLSNKDEIIHTIMRYVISHNLEQIQTQLVTTVTPPRPPAPVNVVPFTPPPAPVNVVPPATPNTWREIINVENRVIRPDIPVPRFSPVGAPTNGRQPHQHHPELLRQNELHLQRARAAQNNTNFTTPPRVATNAYTVYKFDEKCNEEDCPICYEPLLNETFVKLNCHHQFCKVCIKKCISLNKLSCPLCRAAITELHTQNPIVKMYI